MYRSHVLVCGGTGCTSSGSEQIIATLEQEIAKNQDIPGGGNTGSGKEGKTADVENAEQITYGNPAASTEAKNHYVI